MEKSLKNKGVKLNDPDDPILKEAMRRFELCHEYTSDVRGLAKEDMRFCMVPGAQWEEDGLRRAYEGRPKIEINKTQKSVNRILTKYKENRITVDFVPKNGAKDGLAEICDGIFRADASDSQAREAFDTAFFEGVTSGFGCFRLSAKDEDEDDDYNDRQRIAIEPIHEANSVVYWDVDAKFKDKSDANYCFLLWGMSRDAFQEEYGDEAIGFYSPEYNKANGGLWCTGDTIHVAEYYVKKRVKEKLVIFEDFFGNEERYRLSELEKTPEILERLESNGYKITEERTKKTTRVHKYILSQGGILEDCGLIAGRDIPIVPFYGSRFMIEGVEWYQGHVRLSKDPSRLKNMLMSQLAEFAAVSGPEKQIFLPEQISGHESLWAQKNNPQYPYLVINAITDATGAKIPQGPLGSAPPPALPPATAALLQLCEEDIDDMLGRQEGGEEIRSNVSGDSIRLIQMRLDAQSYIYMDAMADAVRRCGEIWLGMARSLYIEPSRRLRTKGIDGEDDGVTLAGNDLLGEDDGIGGFDMRKANMTCSAQVKLAGKTQQSLIVDNYFRLLDALGGSPEHAEIVSLLIMLNVEGDGTNQIKEYARKGLVAKGVLKPNEEDLKRMEQEQNAEPTPQEELLQAAAMKDRALAQKAAADIGLTQARAIGEAQDAEKAAAETALLYAELNGGGPAASE